VSVVRSGRWKLHRFYEGDRHELYDLREDVSETENLADERPDIRRELRRRLDDWLDATDARRPRRRGL
jgi:arylsulfatase A-like enzyme